MQNCPIQPKYEAYKIWAAWIIAERSLNRQIDFFLPCRVKVDKNSWLITALLEKGCAYDEAVHFNQQIYETSLNLVKAHLYLKIFYNKPITLEPTVFHHKNSVTICYQSIKHTLRHNQYYKLSTYYKGAESEFNINLWLMLNNYYLLDGHSYQWALSNRILKVLKLFLKVKRELFASPLNVHYDDYYSLFEVDKMFGSRGNFFNSSADDFQEGVFQVNPPFIDRIFIETVERLLSYLTKAENNQKGLMFIFIMPDWLDSHAYHLATESPFCQHEMILAPEQHYYYSYKEYKYIKVQFATHILVLGNSFSKTWFSNNIMSNILNLFKNPFL